MYVYLFLNECSHGKKKMPDKCTSTPVHFKRLIAQIKLSSTNQNISFVFVSCNKESLNRFPHAQKYPIQKRCLNSLYIFIIYVTFILLYSINSLVNVISMFKQTFNSIPMFLNMWEISCAWLSYPQRITKYVVG